MVQTLPALRTVLVIKYPVPMHVHVVLTVPMDAMDLVQILTVNLLSLFILKPGIYGPLQIIFKTFLVLDPFSTYWFWSMDS